MATQANSLKAARSQRFNCRLTEAEEALIEIGAQLRGVSTSEFVVESACTTAERLVEERAHFILPPKRYQAFLKALDRPPQKKPRLRRLLTEPSVLE